jgi:hypothetical protein
MSRMLQRLYAWREGQRRKRRRRRLAERIRHLRSLRFQPQRGFEVITTRRVL